MPEKKPIQVRIVIKEQTKEPYSASDARHLAARLLEAGVTYIETEQIKGGS